MVGTVGGAIEMPFSFSTGGGVENMTAFYYGPDKPQQTSRCLTPTHSTHRPWRSCYELRCRRRTVLPALVLIPRQTDQTLREGTLYDRPYLQID